ncbi:MAG TPA: protein kinase [Ktedonobacteraceae bacterium]|nr:protein kinase [Ktedonobacteraceae bacterium]
METGRVINRRYLLQRLIKHGQVCAIYQGTDQVLQRAVAIKVVPSSDMEAYRAAIKLTAHFSHPNIVGLYDLVVESETLYIVQELVEGVPFSALPQQQLTPMDVIDIGMQICQALIYADNTSSGVCHGDLTPSSIMRELQGLVRVNNFALPGDFLYFDSWSKMGGNDIVFSDSELPYGHQSESRRADDVRATGILLYQLLAGNASGAIAVEPPADGRLRFQRNVPPDLCETVARAIVRQHPQHICTPEDLYMSLKALNETFAQQVPVVTPVASAVYQQPVESLVITHTATSGTGKLATALPISDSEQSGLHLPSYRSDQNAQILVDPSTPASPTVADVSLKLAAARQAAYPEPEPQRQSSPSFIPILLIGLVVFILLFILGYFLGHILIS